MSSPYPSAADLLSTSAPDVAAAGEKRLSKEEKATIHTRRPFHVMKAFLEVSEQKTHDIMTLHQHTMDSYK
jgi:hypothetical protein